MMMIISTLRTVLLSYQCYYLFAYLMIISSSIKMMTLPVSFSRQKALCIAHALLLFNSPQSLVCTVLFSYAIVLSKKSSPGSDGVKVSWWVKQKGVGLIIISRCNVYDRWFPLWCIYHSIPPPPLKGIREWITKGRMEVIPWMGWICPC